MEVHKDFLLVVSALVAAFLGPFAGVFVGLSGDFLCVATTV